MAAPQHKRPSTEFAFSYSKRTKLPWDIPRALAEIIANAQDEDEDAVIEMHDEITCKIHNKVNDDRPGLTLESFHVTSHKTDTDASHGKFGYGMKDALVCLLKHNVHTIANSRAGRFTVDPAESPSDDTKIAQYDPEQRLEEHATTFYLTPITSAQLQQAKSYFCKYHTELKNLCEVVNRKKRTLKVFSKPETVTNELFFINGFRYKMDNSGLVGKRFLFAYDIGYDKSKLESRERDRMPDNWHSIVCSYMKTPKMLANQSPEFLRCLEHLFTTQTKSASEFWEFGRSEFANILVVHKSNAISERDTQEKLAQRILQEAMDKEDQATVLRKALSGLAVSDAQVEGEDAEEFYTSAELVKSDVDEKEKRIEKLSSQAKQLRAEETRLRPSQNKPTCYTSAVDMHQPALPSEVVTLVLPEAVAKKMTALAPNIPSLDSRARGGVKKSLQALCNHLSLGVEVTISSDAVKNADYQCRNGKLVLAKASNLEDDQLLKFGIAELFNYYSAFDMHIATSWLAKIARLLPTTNAPGCGVNHHELREKPNLLRFLFTCDEWGTKYGGISAVNIQMATDLAKSFDTLEVLTLITDPRFQCSSDEIAKTLADERVRILFPVMERTNIVGIRDCPTIDVVIAHGDISGPIALQLKSLPQFTNARFWLFNHTDPEAVDPYKPAQQQPELAGPKLTTKINSMLDFSSKYDVIFSVGRYIFESWQRAYNGRMLLEKSHYVYYPPLNPFFFPTCETISGYRFESVRLLLFGRVGDATQYFKGIDVACEAAQLLARRLGSSVTVDLVVRGLPPGELVVQFPLLLERTKGAVKIIPRVYGDQHEIKRDLLSSDLCIVPARYEPYGLTGLEAIAAGTPILVSCHTGMARFLSKLGESEQWVVESTYEMALHEAAKQFADKMFNMMTAPLKDHLRSKVAVLREKINKLYSSQDAQLIRYSDLVKLAETGKAVLPQSL